MEKGEFGINENNNEYSITPEYDKNIFEFKGELISFDTEIINIILSDMNRRFELEDFSKFKKEKEVLEYFYSKEKSSLGHIELNFKEKDNEIQIQFLKHFVNEIIIEKYENNKSLSMMREKINKKLDDIMTIIKNSKNIDSINIQELYLKKFDTYKIPMFLEKNIFEAIEVMKLINDLNEKNEKIIKKDSGGKIDDIKIGDSLIIHYFQFLNHECIPFDGGNKQVLFDILLYSNLKDIYKSPKLKILFINNYSEISKCLDYKEGRYEFEDVINNRKEFKYIDDKLISTFNNYEINEYHIYILASYFYLILNLMKEIDINELFIEEKNAKKEKNKITNLNNPLLNKILKNVLYHFFMYCPHDKYSYEAYIYLLNYFDKIIIENEEGKKINKEYDMNDIENIINNSDDYVSKEKLIDLKERIRIAEISGSITKKLIDILTDSNLKNSLIKLVPIIKKKNSHTITILISGFLSQRDDINTWKHFFNYEKNGRANYYMFRWPSSDIINFVLKGIANILSPVTSFLWCYLKAELVGRILALFLINNEEFADCQINLVGFSLGCQVVANCLNELNQLKHHKFMINNVLFMGGATVIEDKYIWRNIIMNNVAGRVINCHSKSDDVLSYLFKLCIGKTPIGIEKIDIKDEKGEYSIVDNYDFSDIKLGHLDYRDKFEIILKRINFFN